jgi:hypothetical protein
MIGEEQSTLDTMAGQVRLINQQKAIVETLKIKVNKIKSLYLTKWG